MAQQLYATEGVSPMPLSESATTLLVQLRQTTVIAPEVTEHLVAERMQKVTTELTAQPAIAATRIHVRREKQRSAGAAEVRYVIQTRESVTQEEQKKPTEDRQKKRKRGDR